jgi:hypothetical protein
MDATLAWTIVGAVAGVVAVMTAVLIGVLQLRKEHNDATAALDASLNDQVHRGKRFHSGKACAPRRPVSQHQRPGRQMCNCMENAVHPACTSARQTRVTSGHQRLSGDFGQARHQLAFGLLAEL